MRELERIEWPEPASVDLLHEFHWIVGDSPPKGQSSAQLKLDARIGTLKGTSPYSQLFAEAHRSKIVLAPDQQAERRVQRVKLQMESEIMANNESPQKKKQKANEILKTSVATTDLEKEFDLNAWKNEAEQCLDSPIRPIPTENARHEPPILNNLGRESILNESPITSSCEINDHDSDAPPREFPEDPWITAELAAPEVTEGFALEIDPPPTKRHDNKSEPTTQNGVAKYSIEMQERILGTIYSHIGEGMWADPVASHLAVEFSSEIVFGAGSEGSAPPFVVGETQISSETLQKEAEWIQMKSAHVHETASAQIYAGNVQEALATLEEGVHSMLQDRENNKSTWGFNYSKDVHKKANLIQRAYRRRYNKLSIAATQVEKIWRGFHSRIAFEQIKWRRHMSAKCIQQWWHRCNIHKEKMRLRIQTAIRARLARKKVHELRNQKKLLRNLRLFVRAWQIQNRSLNKQRRKHGYEHFCVLTKDRWIRGYLARYYVRQLKQKLLHEEEIRYKEECVFVSTRLPFKINDFETYLRSSEGAVALNQRAFSLKGQALQRLDERSRRQLDPVELRRLQVHDIFATYDIDDSNTIDSDELSHLFDELGIPIDKKGIASAIQAMDTNGNGTIEFEEFFNWLQAPPAASKSKNLRDRQALAFLKMKLNVKQIINRFTLESFRQHAKRRMVYENTCRHTKNLQSAFRAVKPPKYACRYCGAPFALYKAHYEHENMKCTSMASTKGNSHSVEESELVRASQEQKAVDDAVGQVLDKVMVYLASKSGKKILAKEIQRISRSKLPARPTTELDRVRELFLTYDLDSSNSVDITEFAQLTRDLGSFISGAKLNATFKTLDTDNTGALSFDEFSKWWCAHKQEEASKPAYRRLSQKLFQLVHGKKRKSRAEAIRYIVAREKIWIESKTRRSFRTLYPPPFECTECDAVFSREEAANVHAKNADAIHMKLRQKREAVDRRIGLNEPFVPHVIEAMDNEVEAKAMHAAVARYISSSFGERAVGSMQSILKSYQHDKKQLQRFIVSMYLQNGAISVHHVPELLELLGLSSKSKKSAIHGLGVSPSDNVMESKLLELLDFAPKPHIPYLLHSKNQIALKLAQMRYQIHLAANGLEGEPLVGGDDTPKMKDFDVYLSSPVGNQMLLEIAARLNVFFDAKKPLTLCSMSIDGMGEQIFKYLDFNHVGHLSHGGVKFALKDAQVQLYSQWLTQLDPQSTGEIELLNFLPWFRSFGFHFFCFSIVSNRIVVKIFQCQSPLTRFYAALLYFHYGNCIAPVIEPKTESYTTSSVGVNEIQHEASRLCKHYDQLQPRTTQEIVEFLVEAMNCEPSRIGEVEAQAIFLFMNCPQSKLPMEPISKDTLVVHINNQATKFNWRSNVAKSFNRFGRRDRFYRLASVAVNRKRHQTHQTPACFEE